MNRAGSSGLLVLFLAHPLIETELTPDPVPRERRRRASKRRAVPVIIALVSIAFVVVLLIYLGAQQFEQSEAGRSPTVPGELHPWKLEVVNIAGVDGLAQDVTDFLRSRGYDVVEYNSRQLSGIDGTTVVDRVGNRTAAEEVCSVLGLPPERIRTQLDKTLYVDMTVVVGFDYRTFPTLAHLPRKGIRP